MVGIRRINGGAARQQRIISGGASQCAQIGVAAYIAGGGARTVFDQVTDILIQRPATVAIAIVSNNTVANVDGLGEDRVKVYPAAAVGRAIIGKCRVGKRNRAHGDENCAAIRATIVAVEG